MVRSSYGHYITKMYEMDENWQQIPGYEGLYEVSDMGRVRSLKFGKTRIMKTPLTSRGYKNTNLTKDGVHTNFTVHRLVMLAFVGERPDGMVIDHINQDQTDNRLCNLRYTTNAENVRVGKRTPFVPSDIIRIRELLITGMTQTAIGKLYGVSQRCISSIANGKRWADIAPETAQ